MDLLSTREWAGIIWGVLLMAYVLTRAQLRKSLWNVIKCIFNNKLRVLWEVIVLYVLVLTVIFSMFPIWNVVYIKDIVIWFLFSGIVFCVNAVSHDSDETYIKKVLINNIKLTIIIEFLFEMFTFNIWLELLIIPIVFLLTITETYTERKEEYKEVHKLSQFILTLFGFVLLYGTIKVGIQEYRQLDIIYSLVSFLIPIVFTVLVIPLEYAIELYSKYENLFIRMRIREEDSKKIQKEHRRLIIKNCKFSVRKVLVFQRDFYSRMFRNMPEKEYVNLINEFRTRCDEGKVSFMGTT